jgi:hypothetical protein
VCGCFVLLLGAFAPRLALVLMALFNDEITRAFDGNWVVPFIGWLFLPYTTLVYVLVHWWQGDVTGFFWFFVVLAFLSDLSSYFGSYARRTEIRQYPTNYGN